MNDSGSISAQGGQGYFHYPEMLLGRISGIYAPNNDILTQVGNVNRVNSIGIYTDVIPYIPRTVIPQAPIFFPFGIFRMPRVGQQVTINWIDGKAQAPIILGLHAFNQNPRGSRFEDPFPQVGPDIGGGFIATNPDDFIVYHDETYSYLRFRNPKSTGGTLGKAAQDGGPAQIELATRSGAKIEILETVQPGYPQTSSAGGVAPPFSAAPTMAKITITSASGYIITLDDTEKMIQLQTPLGHKIVLDDVGHSPIGITIQTGQQQLLHELDDTAGTIKHVAGEVYHELDKVNKTIEHVISTGKLALGAKLTEIENDVNKSITNQHVRDLVNSIMNDFAQSLTKQISIAAGSAGIPGAGAWEAIIGAANWVVGNVTPPTVPSGAAHVFVKND